MEFLHIEAKMGLYFAGITKEFPEFPVSSVWPAWERIEKSLRGPWSLHCWFSGAHPHPGAIKGSHLLCEGSGADLLRMVSQQKTTPPSQQDQDQLLQLPHNKILWSGSCSHWCRHNIWGHYLNSKTVRDCFSIFLIFPKLLNTLHLNPLLLIFQIIELHVKQSRMQSTD